MNSPKTLRVLHVYAGNLYGGIETFLRTLAEERAACGEMTPEFALCFEGRLADEIRKAGAQIQIMGAVRLSRPWTVLYAQRRLYRLIRARRPDIVICHAAWAYVVFAPAIRIARARLVFYRHDIGSSRGRLNRLAQHLRPDLVIANSQYSADHAHPKFRGVEQKVVYPAVRVPTSRLSGIERAKIRTDLGATSDDVVILQASRMQRMKGHRLLLEALSLLPTTPSWTVWIVGSAQRPEEQAYVDELRNEVVARGFVNRVKFLGDRRNLFDLMQAADIFCQPNLTPESFGIVFVEALTLGLRILTTTAAGGALEILRHTRGSVVGETPRDVADGLNSHIADVHAGALTPSDSRFANVGAALEALMHSLRSMRANELRAGDHS